MLRSLCHSFVFLADAELESIKKSLFLEDDLCELPAATINKPNLTNGLEIFQAVNKQENTILGKRFIKIILFLIIGAFI